MKGMGHILDSCVPPPHCRKPRRWGPWRGWRTPPSTRAPTRSALTRAARARARAGGRTSWTPVATSVPTRMRAPTTPKWKSRDGSPWHAPPRSLRVGHGASTHVSLGTCPHDVGPGRLRWGQPQAGRMSATQRWCDWESRQAACSAPALCLSPSLCCDTPPSPSCPLPPPALCCVPQPPAAGTARRTNSTAPQGSPGQLAPRPSLPQPQISGHPPCQSHWGLQPVFPADLPGTCLNPAPVTPQPPPSFPTSALATGLPGFAACPAPQEAQTLRCC